MLRELVQGTIEREFQAFMGAERWQRSEGRRGWRNGSKPRRFETRVGTLELRFPKEPRRSLPAEPLRALSTQRESPRARSGRVYLQAVSPRRVTKVVEELCGTSVSASKVSGLVKMLDTEREAWRTRSLAGGVTLRNLK